MIVTLRAQRAHTLEQVRSVTEGNDLVEFEVADWAPAYDFIPRTLVQFDYSAPGKANKGSAAMMRPIGPRRLAAYPRRPERSVRGRSRPATIGAARRVGARNDGSERRGSESLERTLHIGRVRRPHPSEHPARGVDRVAVRTAGPWTCRAPVRSRGTGRPEAARGGALFEHTGKTTIYEELRRGPGRWVDGERSRRHELATR